MTCKDQIKILNDNIKSNANQFKVDRLNAEISAFSSGDLNKYEFLARKDLKYKPNALDKARFDFSPLGQTFSTGLDKNVQGYQEEGVIKLLKDIRDGLARAPPGPGAPPDSSDEDDNMPDLETEEEAAERIADSYDNRIKNFKNGIDKLNAKIKDSELSNKEKDKLNKELIESNNKLEDFIEIFNDIGNEDKDKVYSKLSKFKNNMEDNINKLEKINEYLDKFDNKMSVLNDKIFKINYTIKNKTLTSAEKDKLQNKIKDLESQKNSINNELSHAVHIRKKKFPEKFKKFEEIKKSEFKESKESDEDYFNFFDESRIHKCIHTKYDFGGFDRNGFDINGFDRNGFDIDGFDINGFDRNGFHKNTKTKYDFNNFDINGLNKDTESIYDRNGFDRYGVNQYTKDKYDRNGFVRYGVNQYTKDKYDIDGFDIDSFDRYGFDRNGKHKDTDVFLNKKILIG